MAAGPEARFLAAAGALTSAAGTAVNTAYLADEAAAVRTLCGQARLPQEAADRVQARAQRLVQAVRATRAGAGLDAILQQYHLASPEGVILMCLAEALLRIPDAGTADRLIADRLSAGDWERHLGDSDSLLVNASTWGLMLTGRLVNVERGEVGPVGSWLGRLAARIGEPVARSALRAAMRVLGHQFVMGATIGEALQRSTGAAERRYAYSYDMLGESALTRADAECYFAKYRAAVSAIAEHWRALRATGSPEGGPGLHPGISVKLSALYPRYELAQRAAVMRELLPQLEQLVLLAQQEGVLLTVDAEEAERLELSLELFAAVLRSRLCAHAEGRFGLAVQAYQKRAPAVLAWLAGQARSLGRRIHVRLVKGAYWDSEIKRAQERGLAGFPVFTRKVNTDVSYLACARQLRESLDVIRPQFATHNAHTVAYVCEVMRGVDPGAFEFQRLHGMGEALHQEVLGSAQAACRVYAPVGAHADLLPYLVRRLLENGANTSFVNRIFDESVPAEAVVADPVAEAQAQCGAGSAAHPGIAPPERLFGTRRNSRGINFADGAELAALQAACEAAASGPWRAGPGAAGQADAVIVNPADETEVVGTVVWARPPDVQRAVTVAAAAQPDWDLGGVEGRAALLERAADLFEEHHAQLIARCVREAGRTVPDAAAEVREAVDFLRYYAAEARARFAEVALLGPAGERNLLRLSGRGVFACISPWNFPVSIFTGQVAAALAAGNAVVAKPAEQTPLTAALAVELLHRAGVPSAVLQLLPGDGAVGAALVGDPRIAGVAFTGSTATARAIERTLAARDGPIAVLIAETGGINVMVADSSALPEQVVLDAVSSGFNSAGQRCSALRVLALQEEIAPRVLELLAGQMDLLRVGDPRLLATDVGPVIERAALAKLEAHARAVLPGARWSHRTPLPEGMAGAGTAASTAPGRFFAPLAVEVESLAAVHEEVFGPVVHVVRYRAQELDALIDGINALGYGLTFGIHTRIDSRALEIARRLRVGNVYVNRNMIGAVVGAQPFGGQGLSGTGPKAGGPHYLLRFATEQVVTVNTAALGGNAALLAM